MLTTMTTMTMLILMLMLMLMAMAGCVQDVGTVLGEGTPAESSCDGRYFHPSSDCDYRQTDCRQADVVVRVRDADVPPNP